MNMLRPNDPFVSKAPDGPQVVILDDEGRARAAYAGCLFAGGLDETGEKAIRHQAERLVQMTSKLVG